MEINDEEARKRQYEIDKDKYKVLFELATQEYKAELERSKSIEDKVSKLFTILNILLSLFIALLTNKYIWEAIKDVLIFFKILEIFLIMFIFYYLITAWLEIFQNLQNRFVEKLKLEPNNPYEEFAFDDLENVNRIYWKVYLTYQESISANEKDSNTRYQSLELARKYIKKALYLFCIFVYTLFLIFIYKGVMQ